MLVPRASPVNRLRSAEGTQIATSGYSIQIKAHTIRVTQIEKAESEGCGITHLKRSEVQVENEC